MKRLFLLIAICFPVSIFAQEDSLSRITNEIMAEGTRLYRSEMASWYGTDIFLEKYPSRSKLGGYFSYENEEGVKCVFFSNDENPVVIGAVLFDSSYTVATAKTDLSQRGFSGVEKDLYSIRTKTLSIIQTDTSFTRYENTSMNLIPLVKGDERKVYVLTGPQKNGVVVLGNDYLFNFDRNNELVSYKRLHRNIIWMEFSRERTDSARQTMHTHLSETGEYMTPTDVCTLMLYGKYTPWEQHIVVSKNYLSIWNCKTNDLLIITKAAIERINEDQKKRHPEKRN